MKNPARRNNVLFPAAILAVLLLAACGDAGIARNAGRSGGTGGGEAEKNYVAAAEAYAAGNYAQALELVRLSLSYDKKFYQASFLEGRILFFSGGETEAREIFRSLVSRYPQYTEARIWHIRCLILADEYSEAQRLLETELSFNSTDWRIYSLWALLARKTDNYQERIAMNRRAEGVLTDASRVFVDMALSWHVLGMNDRARDYLEKARALTGTGIPMAELERALEEFME